jgi:hypothetical protein
VTVVFRSPAGPRSVEVLADDCAALEGRRRSCEERPDVGSATCVVATRLAPDSAGGTVALPEILALDEHRLRFRFPDSDAILLPAEDDLVFTGPAAIAVTAPDDPLPCRLASEPCRAEGGLFACVDALHAQDGSCSTAPDPTFPSFTALPPPNDYEAACTPEPPPSTSPCDGTQDEIRFAVDDAGNALIPVDWRGVLFRADLVPVLRLVRATSTLEAFPGRGAPSASPTSTCSSRSRPAARRSRRCSIRSPIPA